jgi:cysteine desulfurase/selenocysteine lyase
LSAVQLRSINGLRIYGPSPDAAQGRAALATFNVEGIHPTDISTILDSVSADGAEAMLPASP